MIREMLRSMQTWFPVPGWIAPMLGGLAASQLLASVTPAQIGEYIQVANTAILMLGGTALLLWRQRAAALREEAVKDEQIHRDSLTDRLTALAGEAEESRQGMLKAQRDRDEIHERLDAILARLPEGVCPFIEADGRARCHGADAPVGSDVKPWPPVDDKADTAEFKR
jgi:uncharacterized membrane protein